MSARKTDEHYLKKIIPLLKQGKKKSEIVRETGIGKSIVYRLCKQYTEKDLVEEKKDRIIELHKNISKVNDFVTECNLEFINTQKAELDEVRQFINMLKYPNEIISELQSNYEMIGKMNIEMQRLLHKLEDSESEEELLNVAKELFLLRKKRRIIKNKHRIAYQLRNIFSNNRTHSLNLVHVADALTSVVDSIENYNEYNPKDPELDIETLCTDEYEIPSGD